MNVRFIKVSGAENFLELSIKIDESRFILYDPGEGKRMKFRG